MVFNGCASVKIKNHELCVDKGLMGAFCAKTLSDEKREVDKSNWDSERMGMICAKSDVIADIKKALEKLCNETQGCTYEQVQAVKILEAMVEIQK